MFGTIILVLFLTALVLQAISLLKKIEIINQITPYFLLVISLALYTMIVMRSISIRFVALTNTYEALMFFSASITLVIFIYMIVMQKQLIPVIIFFTTAIAFVLFALGSSPIASSELKPPIPALRSGWLIFHVAFTFVGEAFFAFSFMTAFVYLMTKNENKKNTSYRLMYTSVCIGYPIFTIGALIFGAIWAHYAWGSFWSWDPKEIFALVTWLVYTLFLHIPLIKNIDKRIVAIVSIIGFLLTLFTFFGVNYLLPSLHSYK